MEFINLYYYTSIPLITCNLLFYSMNTLSNSITSTQNVFKFIYEHKIFNTSIIFWTRCLLIVSLFISV